MEWERLTTDQLERQLLSNQISRSALDAEDLEILEVLDSRQTATADGCKSLTEWTAARLDVGLDTARTMVQTMRRTETRPDLRDMLATGELTLDRVDALSRLEPESGFFLHLDVAGVRREAAKRARIEADAEFRSADDQFIVMQPSLDESWWRLWGGLDGPSGAIVDKVLCEQADQIPDLPDGTKGENGWRKAIAFTQLCVSDDPAPTQVTVFVDADRAVSTNGEAGVVLEAGPRAGRRALEAVLCDSVTEVIARTDDGRYLDFGRKHRTAPPSLRRALLDKWAGRCAADGCNSRNRLQVHHTTPWAEGGETNQDDLVLLCWFHHHVVIHQRGFEIVIPADTGRIRFRKPDRST